DGDPLAALDSNGIKRRSRSTLGYFLGGTFIRLVISGYEIKKHNVGQPPAPQLTSTSEAEATLQPQPPPPLRDPPSYKTDCAHCGDNADLVNHYERWINIQVECKLEAERQARYGTPTWPWLAFSGFVKGKSYITSGKAVAVENDARFQNGFGAMVHSTVVCTYDLRANRVLKLAIAAH